MTVFPQAEVAQLPGYTTRWQILGQFLNHICVSWLGRIYEAMDQNPLERQSRNRKDLMSSMVNAIGRRALLQHLIGAEKASAGTCQDVVSCEAISSR